MAPRVEGLALFLLAADLCQAARLNGRCPLRSRPYPVPKVFYALVGSIQAEVRLGLLAPKFQGPRPLAGTEQLLALP